MSKKFKKLKPAKVSKTVYYVLFHGGRRSGGKRISKKDFDSLFRQNKCLQQ